VTEFPRASRRVIVLLCITVWSSTFAVGAFPPLLRDLDRAVGLSAAQLGALAGAYGFARMVVDVPVGLLVARQARVILRVAPILLTCGILAIGSGGPFAVLLAGRIVMGLAHALGMVSWLSTILRHVPAQNLAASLNAFELSAMIGMLGGVTLIGALPAGLAWNVALLIASVPQITGVLIAPVLVRALPAATPAMTGPIGGRTAPGSALTSGTDASARSRNPEPPARRATSRVRLAFAAGAAIALTYSTAELFFIPVRTSREFALDRAGVAKILMFAQITDISALLPVGAVADRVGPSRVLGVVMLSMAAASSLIAFGTLGEVRAGAMLYGLGMAGWMLPLAVMRRQTSPEHIAWRTALYRVGVDAGMFLGPFTAGLLGNHGRLLPLALTLACGTLGAVFVTRPR
jgi:MFS transporter, ACS family, D-galactonate transporter